MVTAYIVRAVDDPSDDEARAQMLLAASYAGVGFGNAGVHLPHGMSYPVSGNVKTYRAPGYHADHPLVPHGFSVILNAPAVFRFTASANPARHLVAAQALGADVSRARDADAGTILADRITWFMQRLGTPNGLRAIGYTSADIPSLVEGTLPQHRVTKLSPRPAGPEELSALFEEAMSFVSVALLGLASPPAAAQAPFAPPPQIPYGMSISTESAKSAAAASIAEVRKNNWTMAIAIVDTGGHLVYFEKMQDTQTASVDLAIEKARTSALFKRPTRVFQEGVAAGGDGLRLLRLTGAIPNAGGVPIIVNGKLVGAVGVSGGSVDQDEQVAKAGASAVK